MSVPNTTLALALREGGFASAPTPQVPESLAPHLELREVNLPALGPGQVLVEVALSPVNPSDLFFVQGGYGQPRVQGNAAGFEGAQGHERRCQGEGQLPGGVGAGVVHSEAAGDPEAQPRGVVGGGEAGGEVVVAVGGWGG